MDIKEAVFAVVANLMNAIECEAIVSLEKEEDRILVLKEAIKMFLGSFISSITNDLDSFEKSLSTLNTEMIDRYKNIAGIGE